MDSQSLSDMESHHVRLRPIGYNTLRVKSNSLSSESSCNQNSPEYPHNSVSGKQHPGSTSDWYIRNQLIESLSKSENLSTCLFNNKKDLQLPKPLEPKTEKNTGHNELKKCMETTINKEEQPLKKKKISLMEYKLRRDVSANTTSAQVSPEVIFPDVPSPGIQKAFKCPCPTVRTTPNELLNTVDNETKFLDPIKEAARKFSVNPKKRKAEAIKKTDEAELQKSKPLEPKPEKNTVHNQLNKCMETTIKKEELPLKKKKISLMEYKLRRDVSSNTTSAQVSPEVIFPDVPSPGLHKAVESPTVQTTPNVLLNTVDNETKFLDPIKEAARKFSVNPKKRKAEAIKKTDEAELQKSKPLEPKPEKNPVHNQLNKCMETTIKKEELPLKKKKISLMEYKLRRDVSSNTTSAQVSPEVIFPDVPSPGLHKAVESPTVQTTPNVLPNTADNETKFLDPIKEAARKFLVNSKKRKAEAIRKRDEAIVMSKVTKVENFQLQPLISDAEMMKIENSLSNSSSSSSSSSSLSSPSSSSLSSSSSSSDSSKLRRSYGSFKRANNPFGTSTQLCY